MTDEYEDFYSSIYDRANRNQDSDGASDVNDIVPRGMDAAVMKVVANAYKGDADCDVATGADPYIPSDEFWIKIGSGGQITLKAPQGTGTETGWSSKSHMHDRGSDVVSDLTLESASTDDMVAGVLDLPDHIDAWAVVTDDELPKVTLTIGLKDHDHASDSDRMDLHPGAEVVAELVAALTFDGSTGQSLSSKGNVDGCAGTIGFNFLDNAPARAIHTAVYHRQNPTSLIGLGDV